MSLCCLSIRSKKWLKNPTRKRGTFEFGDVDSFCRYFNEHKTPDSRIFATVTDDGGSFEGILNFHGADPSFSMTMSARHTLKSTKEWGALESRQQGEDEPGGLRHVP